MLTTHTEALSVQLERLRALYVLLAAVPDSRRHDELIDCARLAIADVRKTRTAMAAMSRAAATVEQICR